MEMHQLKYFLAVAETGSFSRAAERCYVSQPSLSQQIIKLEQEVGQPLFDRAGRRVMLTQAGKMLVEHARTILMTVENATKQLKSAGEDVSVRLSVGVIPTIGPYILPKVIGNFLKSRPNIDLVIQEDYTQRLITALCEGEIDIAIMALPINNDQLAVETLGTDALLLALPRGHKLTKKRRVKTADVRDERFVLINEMHCLGEQVASFCRQHEFQPGVVCRSAQISTVQALVELDQGISILPAMARDNHRSSRLVYCEFGDEKPSRTIVAAHHRHRYMIPQAQEFIDTVRQHLESK
jgi:LysR family hydrogen peroxide-inducible transcriptional activator